MKTIIKVFDSSNPNWNPDSVWNEMYLQTQQRFFVDLYRCRGYVFLSVIYGVLGLNITQESCVLGRHKNGEINNEGFFAFRPIPGTNNYELVFKCYPILEYFNKED